MNQSLIENGSMNAKTIADTFRAMADKIERNANDVFGGAVVVVPPAGGDSLHILVLDSQQDPSMFWGNLKAKCDIAIASLANLARNQQAFRPR